MPTLSTTWLVKRETGFRVKESNGSGSVVGPDDKGAGDGKRQSADCKAMKKGVINEGKSGEKNYRLEGE
jgi:hypothetical protein